MAVRQFDASGTSFPDLTLVTPSTRRERRVSQRRAITWATLALLVPFVATLVLFGTVH